MFSMASITLKGQFNGGPRGIERESEGERVNEGEAEGESYGVPRKERPSRASNYSQKEWGERMRAMANTIV